VLDTTFNITTPIPNVTIASPGSTGTAQITLTGVDNFVGQVTVTCTLPAAMAEATCPTVTTNLDTSSTNALLLITTTAPRTYTVGRADGKGLYGFGVLACVLLFWMPGGRRRRIPLALLLLVCLTGLGACGGGGTTQITDQGTPAGTYTVNVTATSTGITRTGTFTVTVQ